MKKISILIIGFILIINSGCFSHKLVASYDVEEIIPKKTTNWTFLWGLLETNADIPADCPQDAMSQTIVRDNFAFDLLSVATLGIVHPIRVEWHCSPEKITDDEIPTSFASKK